MEGKAKKEFYEEYKPVLNNNNILRKFNRSIRDTTSSNLIINNKELVKRNRCNVNLEQNNFYNVFKNYN